MPFLPDASRSLRCGGWAVAGLAVTLVLCGLATARAAAPDKEMLHTKVQTYLSLAADLFAGRDYEGALVELQRAEALEPLASVRFNIARCYEELKRPAEAQAAFERYLATPDTSAGADDRQRRAREAVTRFDKLLFGSLEVTCEPGALVEIPGLTERPAACPFKAPHVKPATYTVKATQKDCLPYARNLLVDVGEAVSLEITMARIPPRAPLPPGALSVVGAPFGCRVVARREGMEKTGTLPWVVTNLAPGAIHVELSAPGYSPASLDVEVKPTLETRLHVDLAAQQEGAAQKRAARDSGNVELQLVPLRSGGVPGSGALSVVGSPGGATVRVIRDGVTKAGDLPWTRAGLRAGIYRVEVTSPGMSPVKRDVEVVAGQDARLTVRLEAAPAEPAKAPGDSSVQVSFQPLKNAAR
jgi:hypothetical protein